MLDKLARCQGNSSKLITSMQSTFKSRYDRSELLLELPTRYLLVGLCDSRFSGVARFYPHEVVYSFEHPTHRQVEMHMKYADMLALRMARADGGGGARDLCSELRFRIRNQLAYFAREYDATNASHELRLGFCDADAQKLESHVLPRMRELAAG